MMKKLRYPPPSVEWHANIGRKLRDARCALTTVRVTLPKANPARKAAVRAYKAVLAAASQLESEMFRAHPDLPSTAQTFSVYFGDPND